MEALGLLLVVIGIVLVVGNYTGTLGAIAQVALS